MNLEKDTTVSCGCSKPSPKPKPCCGTAPKVEKNRETVKSEINKEYITGWLDTGAQKVPRVSTQLSRADKWNGIKVRLDMGRNNYKVEPGLYAVGNPRAESMVLVTANYKLTFDSLRKELNGIDAWILVLDTKGVNVWCAAGKGTFGTAELVSRIESSGLKDIVSHRRVIVPQLGATGVSAHEVKKGSGFSVVYGPVRAADIPLFLESGMVAKPGMRRVSFSMYDRMQVAPIEIVLGASKLLYICIAVFLLSGVSRSGYSLQWDTALFSVINILLAYVAGTIIGPLLLPWLPGRSFSLKGAEAGILVFIVSYLTHMAGSNILHPVAWLLIITAFSSFLTLNFTGGSTYTSLSGVKKEMRAAIPIQITAAFIGVALWISGRFF
jgi:hypothetical protein